MVLLLVDKITLLYGHNGGVFPRELDATHASEGLRFKSGAEAQVPVHFSSGVYLRVELLVIAKGNLKIY